MARAYETEKARYLRYLIHSNAEGRVGREEELRTTPLFSLSVKYAVDKASEEERDATLMDRVQAQMEGHNVSPSSDDTTSTDSGEAERAATSSDGEPSTTPDDDSYDSEDEVLPQYALLGFGAYHKKQPNIASQKDVLELIDLHKPDVGNDGIEIANMSGDNSNQDGRSSIIAQHEPVMLNVHAPNSAFICGSQGSGKSYTLSCMLENCLLPTTTLGQVQHPVAGVVFHYDVDSAGSVAEAAHLCSQGINVNVLVSNTNYLTLKQAYEALPGAEDHLRVQPLLLRSGDLSIERMLKLMAFAEKDGRVPLYMEVIQRILREMAVNGQGAAFNYKLFRAKVDQEKLSRDQISPMKLRFDLLDSFMADKKVQTPLFNLQAGTLTIVDLSDAFVDAATVCVLFDICLSIIKAQRPPCGLVVALDEAHKYMDESAAATNFTTRLLTTVREQRHNATRVIIATQEPTISKNLLDLCSVSIVHRFTSPAWFGALQGHLGAASGMAGTAVEEQRRWFEKIMDLRVGEALVFTPSSFVGLDERGKPEKLGSRVLEMKTRLRAGADGGKSVLAEGH